MKTKLQQVRDYVLGSCYFSFRARRVFQNINMGRRYPEDISRGTVNKALAQLARDGLIEKGVTGGRTTYWKMVNKATG